MMFAAICSTAQKLIFWTILYGVHFVSELRIGDFRLGYITLHTKVFSINCLLLKGDLQHFCKKVICSNFCQVKVLSAVEAL